MQIDDIMTATLDVTDLRKQFAIGRPAVDGVSFAVPAGEIVVLLGPSGCGKTTTLRCVAGLEHPTGGEISIAGRLVSSPERGVLVPPRLRDLGMVFQSYAVWPHMTVRQNVVYPLKHRKIARARGRPQGRRGAGAGGPNGIRRPAGGGAVGRPDAARGAGAQHRVPAAAPAARRAACRTSTRNCGCGCATTSGVILKQTGMTALYVTHDQAEAVVLGDRIGVMRDGKLLQIGTPDEIYNRPADLFVANFTGATNELTGTLVGRNGEFGMVDFGGGHRGEAALLQALEPGDKVRIALRPETIGIGKQQRRQPVSGPRGRSPLSGHPDRLRRRSVRPAAGSARTRHRGAAPGRSRDARCRCRARAAGPIGTRGRRRYE